jgi:hypothetical protein
MTSTTEYVPVVASNRGTETGHEKPCGGGTRMMKSKTPYWNLGICPGLSVYRGDWRLHIRKDMRCSGKLVEKII